MGSPQVKGPQPKHQNVQKDPFSTWCENSQMVPKKMICQLRVNFAKNDNKFWDPFSHNVNQAKFVEEEYILDKNFA